MTEGFEIPLHRSLTEPVLMAGAPRGLAISIPGLLIWLLGHSAAVFLARRDPDFMATLIRALRHKEHLSC